MDEVVYDGQGNPIPAYLTPPYDDFSVWLICRIVGGIYHPRVDIPREGHDHRMTMAFFLRKKLGYS
jgi:hypothetical protein